MLHVCHTGLYQNFNKPIAVVVLILLPQHGGIAGPHLVLLLVHGGAVLLQARHGPGHPGSYAEAG